MRCEYMFPIRGELLAAHSHQVTVHGWSFEFVRAGEIVTALRVVVPFPPEDTLPSFTPPTPERSVHFNFVHPLFDEVVALVRTTFGLLGFYQSFDVETASPAVRYLPESDDERAKLSVFGARIEPPPPVHARVQFRHLLQCLIAAPSAARFETALSFLRKGELALHERRYIEAIYYYFFALESEFGSGKSGSRELQKALLAAPVLVSCIERLLVEPDSFLANAPKAWAHSPAAVVRHLVLLRGRLHHHSARSSRSWHPDGHHIFRTDCACLAEITNGTLIKLASRAMFTPETKAQIRALCPHESGA
jgi:hypothetical protein